MPGGDWHCRSPARFHKTFPPDLRSGHSRRESVDKMAQITAKMVKDLRERTDLPMMECKQALSETDGDFEAAVEWLKKKHKGKISDRSGKETGEGRVGIYISDDKTVGGIVDFRCETAPVAKNEAFMALADGFAKKVADGGESTPDVEAIRNDPEMDNQFTEVFGKLRESMNLTAARRLQGGYVTSYVHHDGKSGVMIALDAKPSTDAVAADLCMHTTFTKPLAIKKEELPAEQIEKVRADAIEMAKAEGKNDSIQQKIAEGKVASFCAENALMEQLHVKTDEYGKKKVRDVLKEAGVNEIVDMAYMKIGG